MFNKETQSLVAFPVQKKVSEYIIPDWVVSVEKKAFYGNSNLMSVVLPDGLTSIGYSAFMNCINLKTINLPETITNIEAKAFEKCELNKIVIRGFENELIQSGKVFKNPEDIIWVVERGSSNEEWASNNNYNYLYIEDDKYSK